MINCTISWRRLKLLKLEVLFLRRLSTCYVTYQTSPSHLSTFNSLELHNKRFTASLLLQLSLLCRLNFQYSFIFTDTSIIYAENTCVSQSLFMFWNGLYECNQNSLCLKGLKQFNLNSNRMIEESPMQTLMTLRSMMNE